MSAVEVIVQGDITDPESLVGEDWQDCYGQVWTIIAASDQGERGIGVLLHGPQLRGLWYETLLTARHWRGGFRWTKLD